MRSIPTFLILAALGAAGMTLVPHAGMPFVTINTSFAASIGATSTKAISTIAPIRMSTIRTQQTKRSHGASFKKFRTNKSIRPRGKQVKEMPRVATSAPTVFIERPKAIYASAPLSVEDINMAARAALVNIFCAPGGGSLNPISGSGVIIDPRGIILTNAHVAQYVLLSEDPKINLQCVARAGAPATPRFTIEALYLPPAWIAAHAGELTKEKPLGTGEHDWALLRITGTRDGSPPPLLPALPADTRENVGFVDNQVLIASYPAEFVGGTMAQNQLFPATSVAAIRRLLTFASTSVDMFSLGGVILAQGGSSGGAVINIWGYLIGLITTTSEGATTAQRDLHAITLDYVDRDIRMQTGLGLAQFLESNLAAKQDDFDENVAPALVKQLIAQLKK